MPKVTIIVPTYNRPHYLQGALGSIQEQTFTDYECIIVDDGSLQTNLDNVYSFLSDKFVYIYQVNKGCAAALNTGLWHSRSKYVTFLADDDKATPESLAARVSYLDAHLDVAMVYANCFYIDAEGKVREGVQTVPWYDYDPSKFFEKLKKENVVPANTVMLRRDVLEKVGGWGEEMFSCEDYELWLRVAHQHKVGYVDAFTTYIRTHPGQKSLVNQQGGRIFALTAAIQNKWRNVKYERDKNRGMLGLS